MGSHLNLVGSIIIAGIIFLTINRFHSSMVETSQEKTMGSIASRNWSSLAKLIEFDFSRIGYGVSANLNPLLVADSTRIHFLSDINENGAIDTVKYELSDADAATKTENPNDKILYRLVNGQQAEEAPLGVTRFRMRYFDNRGNEITDLTQICTLEVMLEVETTSRFNERYSNYLWQTRISPPNLRK